MRETMVRLRKVNGHYVYNNYEIEQFDGRWYIFDGVRWVADFRDFSSVQRWLSDMELIGDES